MIVVGFRAGAGDLVCDRFETWCKDGFFPYIALRDFCFPTMRSLLRSGTYSGVSLRALSLRMSSAERYFLRFFFLNFMSCLRGGAPPYS